ncbi:MAG: DUF6691 family protein [Myxococcota bacterium]
MKTLASALLSGLLFGIGLGVSGMTNADKVINFLDLSDAWDPSLMFVMVGAIAVHLVLYRVILRQPSPLFADGFSVPTTAQIDQKLVGGAALFGIGWGLGGYCPGPGIVSTASLSPNALTFVAAMTVGMVLHQVYSSTKSSTSEAPQ